MLDCPAEISARPGVRTTIQKSGLIVGYRIIVFVGVVLLAASAWTAFSTWRWLQRSVAAPGHVSRLNAGGSHPEIELVTATGPKVSFPQGGLVAAWRVGDDVPVRYDPAAPTEDPSIDRVAAIWTVPLAALFAGFVTIASALAVRLGWLVKVE